MQYLSKLLNSPNEFIVPLVHPNRIRISTPMVVVPFRTIWKQESLRNKILAFLKLKWNPDTELIGKIAKDIFMQDIFGTPDDMGDELFDLTAWHFSRDWTLDSLTEVDMEKAEALEAMTVLTRKRYWEFYSPNLNLRLALKAPQVCLLMCPIVAKIPIISIQYFVDVHIRYAFNSIRKSKHPFSNEIITYLYEILTLQQKTAILFHSLGVSIDNLNNISALHKSEIDSIVTIDSIITNLKASIEKTIVLIGYIFSIANLESKNTHKAKIQALNNKIPDQVKEQPYYGFIEKFIGSDQINKLNDYRTGQLHKKGISKLQPHSYYRKDSIQNISNFFEDLHEQHSKNSAIIISVIALLTDELVKLDKPDFEITDIPCDKIINVFLASDNKKS